MGENEIELTALRFLRFVRSYLIEMTKGIKHHYSIDIILPLSEEDFLRTFTVVSVI